jgi:CRISPR-associated protein Csm2
MAGMRNPRRGGNQQGGNRIVDEIVSNISKLSNLSDLPVDDLVKYADKFGKHLASPEVNLKATQIRRFFDAVKKVEFEANKEAFKDGKNEFNRDDVLLLKPKLAYAAGRQRKEVKPLMLLLGPCIDRVNSREDFKTFVRFIEGMVAYHKFYNGKDR